MTVTARALRDGLPELPYRLKARPVDRRGFPVPWFLCDQDRTAEADGGNWDFRVVDRNRPLNAIRRDHCWLCGEPLGTVRTFVIGPMCAINRITSEPPCHPDCASFAARACPFLANPRAVRREAGMPEDATTAGIMIERNPGAVITWPTRRWASTPRQVGAGILFQIGEPTRELGAWAHGRRATPDELLASIASGLPLLFDAAEMQAKQERLPAGFGNGQIKSDAATALRTIRQFMPGYEAILEPLAEAVRGHLGGGIAA